jgi:hypothetical protein
MGSPTSPRPQSLDAVRLSWPDPVSAPQVITFALGLKSNGVPCR